jgi:ABC-2 type transport system ATP-binding protein
MPAIVVNDLRVDYGSKHAVRGLSFDADYGKVLVVLGPNGAGKSSTIERLEGYYPPTSGTVRIAGQDPFRQRKALAPTIGVMLQGGGVNPRMTAREVLELTSHYYPNPRDPGELIKLLDLEGTDKTSFRRLSGGERQRLLLALALIGRPTIAFLDEPTAGVDPVGRLTIRSVIKNLREEGACVVLTTHELNEAERLADDILIIANGETVYSGSLAQLTEQAGGSRISFRAAPGQSFAELSAAIDTGIEELTPGTYTVQGQPNSAIMAKVATYLDEANITYQRLSEEEASLEDIYLKMVTSPDGAHVD